MLRSAKGSAVLVRVLQAVLCTGFLVYWELASRGSPKTQFLFSRPVLIVGRSLEWLRMGSIWKHIVITSQEAVLGFLLGAGLGLGLALLCYSIDLLSRVLMPLFEVGNAVPRFIFGPLIMLWFGMGVASKAVLAATLVLFVVFFATFTGLRNVDKNLILKVQLLGGSRLHVLLHVLLPSAVSWIFSSLRSGLGFALAGAVVGEYIGASKGLGWQIALSEGLLDSTGVYTGLMWLVLMAVLLNALLGRLEKWISRWQVT